MKLTIEIPDGEYCTNDNDRCVFLECVDSNTWVRWYICKYFHRELDEDHCRPIKSCL